MKTLVFFLEEPSAQKMLEGVLKRKFQIKFPLTHYCGLYYRKK